MINKQRGSTLIVVLMILVIVTLLGTLAIKQGLSSLSIATNSQAQQLLVQSSDAALYQIVSSNLASTSGLATSILGFARVQDGNEVVFCYRPDATFFDMSKVSVQTWSEDQSAATSSGSTGFCDLTANASTSFVSGRKAQLTQVAVMMSPPSDAGVLPFDYTTPGTDSETVNVEESKRVAIYATSVIPGLSAATPAQVTTCLKKPNFEGVTGSVETVSVCLKNLAVPYETQQQDFKLDTMVQRVS